MESVSFDVLQEKRVEISQVVNELNNEASNLERRLNEVRNRSTLNLGALALLNELLPDEEEEPQERPQMQTGAPPPQIAEAEEVKSEEAVEVEEVTL